MPSAFPEIRHLCAAMLTACSAGVGFADVPVDTGNNAAQVRFTALSARPLLIAAVPPSLAKDTRTIDAETDQRLDLLFGSHEPYAAFLVRLKSAAAGKDWPWIGQVIAYPLRVTMGAHQLKLRTPAQFEAHASEIMTSKVLHAIDAQRYASVFASAQGVMIGDGQIWFSAVCKQTDCTNAPVKITAIQP